MKRMIAGLRCPTEEATHQRHITAPVVAHRLLARLGHRDWAGGLCFLDRGGGRHGVVFDCFLRQFGLLREGDAGGEKEDEEARDRGDAWGAPFGTGIREALYME